MKEPQGRERTREIVRIRDKHTCQKCKKKWRKGQRRFDVHHINERKASRKYDSVKNISGLITLCHSCHMKLHGKEIRKPRFKKKCLNCRKNMLLTALEMKTRKHCNQKCCDERMSRLYGHV